MTEQKPDPGYAGQIKESGEQMQAEGLPEEEVTYLPEVETDPDEELEVQEIPNE